MSLNIDEVLTRYGMTDGAHGIVVGVSGGADSVCLLHQLMGRGIPLYVAHLNHNLRGEESRRDENFVRDMCQKLSLPLFVKSVDIGRVAGEKKLSLEECGREQRYLFFDEVAKETGANIIATAHTLSDHLETVLLNMARGTALGGLCGIAPVRDNIIRPLIFNTREEIEAFLKDKNIPYVNDSSNFTDDYSRNKVRNHIVPVLEGLNPSLYKGVARTKLSLTEDADYLMEIASKALEKSGYNGECLKLSVLRKLHRSILSRVLYLAVKDAFGIIAENDCIRSIMDNIYSENQVRYQIKGSFFADSDRIHLWLYDEQRCAAPKPAAAVLGDNPFGNKYVRLSLEKRQNIHNLLTEHAVDYDKIVGQLVLRSRVSGDKITLKKRRCSKSLKKLYIEKGIPCHKRPQLAVLDAGGKVVFAEAGGVNASFAPDQNTENLLLINVIYK